MTKLEERTRNNTFAIMDYLYFHDMAALISLTEDKIKFYQGLIDVIDDLNKKRKFSGLKAELYKHCLLCYVEYIANTNFEHSYPTEIDEKEFLGIVQREILKIAFNHGFKAEEFLPDAEFILEKFELRCLKFEIGYKLVSQVLCYEYDCISVAFFSKLAGLGVMGKVGAYTSTRVTKEKSFLDKVFLRAMLFVEFEILRRKLYFQKQGAVDKLYVDFNDPIDKILSFINVEKTARELANEPYKSVSKIKELDVSDDLDTYLNNITERLGHVRVLHIDARKWVGLEAGWFAILTKGNNPDKPMYRDPSSHVNVDHLEDTCTEIACDCILNFGFQLHPRVANDYVKKLLPFLELLKFSIEEIVKDGRQGLVYPDYIRNFSYHPYIGAQFKQVVDEVNKILHS